MNGQSNTIGCLVLAGKDFPEAVENVLHGWKTTLILKRDLNKLSTRGLLEYEDTTFGREGAPISASARGLMSCSQKFQVYDRAFETLPERLSVLSFI